MLSMEEVRSCVPRNFRSHITEDFLVKLDEAMKDPELGNIMKENFLSYTNVLNNCGSSGIWDYVHAIKFISYKIMGYTIPESWKRVFPEKVERLIKEGNEKFITRYATAYNKNKLVNQIYQQTLIPSYVLNAPLFQKALNELATMLDDPSVRGMARVKACEAILNYTKPPEVSKAEIQVNVTRTDAIAELREVAEQFANNMRSAIESKEKTVEEIIDLKLVEEDKYE